MKQLSIIGNWKSYKTVEEAKKWLETFSFLLPPSSELSNKQIILCTPFTLLSDMKHWIGQKQLSIKLGAQDISPFDEGAYTGGVNGKQLKDFVTYVIIGHSERRQYFGETDEMITKKVLLAKQYGLRVIFCVQGKETPIADGVDLVAYEPIQAIGTGNPADPKNVEDVASFLLQRKHVQQVIYGGSVDAKNVSSFTALPSITGVLPGTASLDPEQFAGVIHYA